jgi:protein SCO1/2
MRNKKYLLLQLSKGGAMRSSRHLIKAVLLAAVFGASIVPTFNFATARADSTMMHVPARQNPTIQAGPAPMGGTLFNQVIPASVLNTPLIDSNGKAFTLASFAGKTIVLADFFTSCAEVCPLTTANMRDIGDAIAAAKLSSQVVVLNLTVDPVRDTPARLKVYKKLFGSNNWIAATGKPSDLTKLWKWFGVYISKTKVDGVVKDWQTGKPMSYDLVHADIVGIIGADQHYHWLDLGSPAVSNPHVLPKKIENYLSAQGHKNLVKPEEPSWSVSAVYGALFQVDGISVGPKMKMKMK